MTVDSFRALTLQSGVLTQLKSPDLLNVGAGLTTSSGVDLSIAAFAGSKVLLGSADSAVEVLGSFEAKGAFTNSSNTQAIFSGTGGISVTGPFSGSSLSLSGDATVTGSLSLTGALLGSSSGKFLSLSVGSIGGGGGGGGDTTVASIDASGNASFDGNLSSASSSVAGNASVGGNLSVTSAISADSAALSSSLTVGAGGGGSVASIDGYGNMSLSGNISATGNANITGNAVVTGTLGVTGLASFVNTSASGNSSVGGNLTVTGATTLTGSLTGSSGSFSSDLSVTGESSVGGNATVGASLSVTGDISGANGSLTGNLDVTGNITASDISGANGSFTGNVTVSQNLSVTQDLSVGGNLTVTGAETIIGISSFTNDATFNGNLTVTDAYYAHLLGDVTLGGAGKSLTVDSASTFNADAYFTKAVVVSGPGSSLDFPAGSLLVDGSSVTATMTAAALNVLFGGAASNADAYHTHDAVEAADLVLLDVSAAGVLDGHLVKMSGDLTIALASNDTISNACVVGIRDGGALKVAGAMKLYFEAAASAPSAGARVYLGADGKASVAAPAAGVALKVGIIIDASAWGDDNSAVVLLQVGEAVVL
jgi:hypothetical protein